MNVIICCGGGMPVGYVELDKVKSRRCKGNLSLGGETIAQRMVRMFRERGLGDITLAYTFDKPSGLQGVSYRQVEYRKGLLSTVFQCRDLISDTIIAWGDIVFSKQALEEILSCEFDEMLFVNNSMLLTKPRGAEVLRAFFDKHKEEFASGMMGHYFINLLFWGEHRNYFKPHVKMLICKHFVGDVDGPERQKLFSEYIQKYLSRGLEPPWEGGWHKRCKWFGPDGWVLQQR